MTLFAETLSTAAPVLEIWCVLTARLMRRPPQYKEPAHTTSSIELIWSHIDVARRPLVLLGGDTWNPARVASLS